MAIHETKQTGLQYKYVDDNVQTMIRLVSILHTTYMIGWFSSPQIIIVHRWQIIMNETHGMNHLERHRRGHGSLLRPPKHFASRNAQHGTYALPPRHE